MSPNRDVSPWYWLIVPLVCSAAYVIILVHQEVLLWWSNGWLAANGEFGVLETAQVVVMVCAIAAGITVLRLQRNVSVPGLRIWATIVLIGCLYILGEEISWGQHYLGWATPQWYAKFNYQQETNLHNLHSGWFIFKPRALLEAFIVIGVCVRPLWRRLRKAPGHPPTCLSYWVWPTHVCTAAAGLVIIASITKRVDKAFGLQLFRIIGLDYGEFREFGIYCFTLFYLWSITIRLKDRITTSQ